jgi:hypothetical protein
MQNEKSLGFVFWLGKETIIKPPEINVKKQRKICVQ